MGRVVHALVVLAVVGASWAQFDDSPVPSRLQVLGAIPVGLPPRGRPPPLTRVRRPQARQQAYLPTPSGRPEPTPPPPTPPTLPTTLPPRPVAEEVEEYDDFGDVTQPPLSPSSPSPSSPPPSLRQQLRAGPDRPVQVQVASPIPISISDIPVQTPTRQQFRQQQNAPPAFRPEQRPLLRPTPIGFEEAPIRPQIRHGQRPQARPIPIGLEDSPIRPQVRHEQRPLARPAPIGLENSAPVRQQVRQQQVRPQPIPIEDVPQVVPRQQFRQQSRPAPQLAVEQQQFVRPQQKQAQPYSPYKNQRERKPVAQVLNKYRDDNPDGSITWGYENDDGSFKEETIGVDCVVRGKYGYVDPDGQRREYSYSSGIPCDKTKEKELEADQGYIDYQNNAYVLPNGESVPIQSISKNKGRRPAAVPANFGK